MATRTIFRQLYLFDCDGGRSSLFDDHTMVNRLPNNCELYLFWNNNDPVITSSLQRMSNYSQVHLCPSRLVNIQKCSGCQLIYTLGKLVKEFSRITIVHGDDRIFQEVREAVQDDFSSEKIHLHAVRKCNADELHGAC